MSKSSIILGASCESDWEMHDQSCYLLSASSYLDFTQAEAACAEQGAALVSVSGEEGHNFLTGL